MTADEGGGDKRPRPRCPPSHDMHITPLAYVHIT